jgi:hypothetical protein
MLARASRLALAAAAFAAFAAAYATTPLSARGWLHSSARALEAAAPAASPRDVVVVPVRDPFAAPAAAAERPPPASPRAEAALPAIPAMLAPLPPNAGALRTAPPQLAPRVAAVVTGPHPYALIDEGTTTRLVAPGETLGGVPIVAIDAGGVRLRTGTVVPPALPSVWGERRP